METIEITFDLSADEAAFLDRLAVASGRSRDDLIAEAVANYTDERLWELQQIAGSLG